jgi:glutathione S-transferase
VADALPAPLPVLYSFRRCPYAIRARLALAHAGVAVELREVALRDKPAAMLVLSPKGTVPVLQLPDGRVLDESLDIMRWALQQRDADGWLARADTSPQAALMTATDGPFKHWLDRYKYFNRFPERSQADYRAETEQCLLAPLEALLGQTPWLGGATPCLTDAAIFPFVRQFAGVDADWWATAPWVATRAWLQAWLDSGLFAPVMVKQPLWAAPQPQ